MGNPTLDIISNFNPRPREEGDIYIVVCLSVNKYFNPRPREEGDKYVLNWSAVISISIHALVKRATIADNDKDKTAIISIHALVKRATDNFINNVIRLYISIHALVKRATRKETA